MADTKVGTKTGKSTPAGRDVYKTEDGENVSEKSTTFKYKGQWINVPSIHNGYQYDNDILRMMLDAEVISPTSTHKSESDAVKAAVKRSKSLKFNEGGAVVAQTEEALGWTAEGQKFADANTVEVPEKEQPSAMSISNVPFFKRPMDASESDRWTGSVDEAGNKEYRTVLGGTYFVKPDADQRTGREKIEQDILPVVKNYLENPTAPSKEQTIDFLKGSLGDAWETFSIPGKLLSGEMGAGEVTFGEVFGLAGGTGAASLPAKVPEGSLRSFGGSNPPTYEPRQKSLFYQSSMDRDNTPQEYLDILNTKLLMFREPIAEFASNVNIPKKGLLGSQFLDLIKKNDSIPEASLQEGIIEPSKRYTKEELLSAVSADKYRGSTFNSVANIASDKPKSFEDFQRQGKDAGFEGGSEVEYFDIPLSSSIGYPGKNFKANNQHYDDDTIVHVRGSIINPSGTDHRNKDFLLSVEGDRYLLVEEIQSDLLTKGFVRPNSGFDAAFTKASKKFSNGFVVGYGEQFGSVDKEIKSIVKELQQENVKIPLRNAFNHDAMVNFNDSVAERGYTTFEDLTEYAVQQGITNVDGIRTTIRNILRNGYNIVDSDGGTYSTPDRDKIVDVLDTTTEKFMEHYKPYSKDYLQRREDFTTLIRKKLTDKKINKEVDHGNFIELYNHYLEEIGGAPDISQYGLPPIRKNKQAVDEALKVLIAKAAASGVSRIVIPPAERIALARGRDLKKEKGDRFYRTYVTDLEKSLSELEANYPVKISNVELPYLSLSKTDAYVDDGDPFGMVQEPVGPDEFFNPGPGGKDDSTLGTIIDISDLIDLYKVEEPRQFAQGGVVEDMNRQMEMFAVGGLSDDGMTRDPVSGNDIPPGSMAEEVRDDIPAQLSEGEYVVPADVVRFFGVKYFEDLRMEAKMGLSNMEANGRIGGEPVPSGGPMAGPTEGALTSEEMAVLSDMGMNVGGFVPQQQPPVQAIGNTQQGMDRGYDEGGVAGHAHPHNVTTEAAVVAPTYNKQKLEQDFGLGYSLFGSPTPTGGVVNMVMLYSPDGLTSQSFTLPAQQVQHDEKIAKGWTTTQVAVTTETSVGEDNSNNNDDDGYDPFAENTGGNPMAGQSLESLKKQLKNLQDGIGAGSFIANFIDNSKLGKGIKTLTGTSALGTSIAALQAEIARRAGVDDGGGTGTIPNVIPTTTAAQQSANIAAQQSANTAAEQAAAEIISNISSEGGNSSNTAAEQAAAFYDNDTALQAHTSIADAAIASGASVGVANSTAAKVITEGLSDSALEGSTDLDQSYNITGLNKGGFVSKRTKKKKK